MARQQQQRSQERGKLLLVPELYRAEVVIPSSRLRVPPSILYLLDKFIVFLLEKVNPNGNHRIDYLALVVDALKIFRGRGEKTSEDRHTKEEEEYSRPESARVIKTKQNKRERLWPMGASASAAQFRSGIKGVPLSLNF